MAEHSNDAVFERMIDRIDLAKTYEIAIHGARDSIISIRKLILDAVEWKKNDEEASGDGGDGKDGDIFEPFVSAQRQSLKLLSNNEGKLQSMLRVLEEEICEIKDKLRKAESLYCYRLDMINSVRKIVGFQGYIRISNYDVLKEKLVVNAKALKIDCKVEDVGAELGSNIDTDKVFRKLCEGLELLRSYRLSFDLESHARVIAENFIKDDIKGKEDRTLTDHDPFLICLTDNYTTLLHNEMVKRFYLKDLVAKTDAMMHQLLDAKSLYCYRREMVLVIPRLRSLGFMGSIRLPKSASEELIREATELGIDYTIEKEPPIVEKSESLRPIPSISEVTASTLVEATRIIDEPAPTLMEAPGMIDEPAPSTPGDREILYDHWMNRKF